MIARLPSPQEILEYQTPNGGWSRNVLESWGVIGWPPPSGWKEQLEHAFKAGQTVGVILECVGCRKAKYFVDYDPYPVCSDCQDWEREKYEHHHNETYVIRQNEKNVVHSSIKPSFAQKVVDAFIPKKKSTYKKEPIPTDIRWAVWERDNFTCRHCGSRKNLSVDHIIPESKGGKATLENCQTLCKSCNSRKGAR